MLAGTTEVSAVASHIENACYQQDLSLLAVAVVPWRRCAHHSPLRVSPPCTLSPVGGVAVIVHSLPLRTVPSLLP